MKRSVIKLASNTLVVTLPQAWVREHGIKKGDELDLMAVDDTIMVRTQHATRPKTIEIDCDTIKPMLRRILLRLYQEGYDQLTLNYDNPQMRTHIQSYLEQMIGFEIVSQGARHAVIQDLGGDTNTDITQLLRRPLLLLKSMIKEGIEAMRKKDFEALAGLHHCDVEINKFVYFALRRLARTAKTTNTSRPMLHSLLRQIEQLADEYKWIFSYAAQHKINASKELLTLLEDLYAHYVKCHELIFNLKPSTALEVARTHPLLKTRIESPTLAKKIDLWLQHALRSVFILTTGLQELQLPFLHQLGTQENNTERQFIHANTPPWADI